MSPERPLLSVRDPRTWLDAGDAIGCAVDRVSCDVRRGETFALVGESGCGKSMTALSIMRLLPDAGGIVGGSVELDGQDLLQMPESGMRDVRGRRIGMIFQEPALSLNPVMTAGEQVAEALRRHTPLEGGARAARGSRCHAVSASPSYSSAQMPDDIFFARTSPVPSSCAQRKKNEGPSA